MYFLVVALSTPAWAAEDGLDLSGWDVFLDGVRTEALENGISEDIVTAALYDLKPLVRVIRSDRKQAEFKQTLDSYMKRRVSAARVENGQKMLAQHAVLLNRSAAIYGVQPRYIVAIWGMETNYGLYQAKEDVIRALATLAYDKRRSSFFRKELMASLQILDEGHITLDRMKGSWAGAMGQSQFMPTSFINYARDGDGDGKADIWENEADVFASIANYLAEAGWRNDHKWGRQVELPRNFDKKLAELKTSPPNGCRAMKQHSQRLALAEWQALGVRKVGGGDLPNRPLRASLVQPDGQGGKSFLVYDNYKAILAYNCANLYAMSVGHLAEKIK